jgi:hypothetical protein
MFPKMRQALAGKAPTISLELRSRTGRLSAGDKGALDQFIARG